MSKMNIKFIQKKTIAGLQILAIFMLCLLSLPANVGAASVKGYSWPAPAENRNEAEKEQDPLTITSISPDEAKASLEPMTITIEGTGFNPGSVAKVNSQSRATTFIDSEHVLVNVSAYDMAREDGGFYITVWNTDGEYSNAAHFTLEGQVPGQVRGNDNPYNYGDNGSLMNGRDNDTSLASSVILGERTFLPSGIIQWVIVAIIVVAIIILGRKVFGTREEYDNTPLKHA